MDVVVRTDLMRLNSLALVGLLLATIYALVLSTRRGREVCERRTHWTVVGGHLLMALTMALVDWRLGLLWLLWSVAHGVPLIVRSEWLQWLEERDARRALGAVVQGLREGEGGDAG